CGSVSKTTADVRVGVRMNFQRELNLQKKVRHFMNTWSVSEARVQFPKSGGEDYGQNCDAPSLLAALSLPKYSFQKSCDAIWTPIPQQAQPYLYKLLGFIDALGSWDLLIDFGIEESDERAPGLQALIVAGTFSAVENGIASTSTPYWDTEDDDDCAELDIPIKSQEDALAFDNLFVQDCKFKLWFLNDLILSLALLSIFHQNNFIMSYCMLHGLKPKKRIGEWPKRQGCGSS
ncbi:hypothetical protein Tco_1115950, partial [Tanacetum coccineum]